jgi:hypothetical protein
LRHLTSLEQVCNMIATNYAVVQIGGNNNYFNIQSMGKPFMKMFQAKSSLFKISFKNLSADFHLLQQILYDSVNDALTNVLI